MPVDRTAQPLRQVNAALLTKGGDRLARLRVQTDQVAVAGAKKDALIVTICPVGDAPMHEAVVGRSSVLPCLRVVYPPGLAFRGVDGRDLGERGTDIQDAADHQGGGFPSPSFQMICSRDLFFGGTPCPRGPQAIEIISAYLSERRIFRTGLVAGVVQPFHRRAPDLSRLNMYVTVNRHPRVRGLSRLHEGCHSSQERCCDQGRPSFQSFSPGPDNMDMLLIGVVTLIAHGRCSL